MAAFKAYVAAAARRYVPDGLVLDLGCGVGHDLVRERGCVVDDLVTELSFGYRLDGIPVAAERITQVAVEAGRLDGVLRTAWLEEQRVRDEAGTFRASWPKVLVIARAPEHGG